MQRTKMASSSCVKLNTCDAISELSRYPFYLPFFGKLRFRQTNPPQEFQFELKANCHSVPFKKFLNFVRDRQEGGIIK